MTWDWDEIAAREDLAHYRCDHCHEMGCLAGPEGGDYCTGGCLLPKLVDHPEDPGITLHEGCVAGALEAERQWEAEQAGQLRLAVGRWRAKRHSSC